MSPPEAEGGLDAPAEPNPQMSATTTDKTHITAPPMTADDDYAEDLRDWYDEDNPDGVQLLDELRDTFTSYVAFPDQHSRSR